MAHPLAGDEETLVLPQALYLVGLTRGSRTNPFTSFDTFHLHLLGAFLSSPDLKKAPQSRVLGTSPLHGPILTVGQQGRAGSSQHPRGASGAEWPPRPLRGVTR